MDPLSSPHFVTSLLSTMAAALPSTLFLSPSKPSSLCSSKSPFLSLPHFSTLAAARPPPRISSATPAFRVRCQNASALVPEEQQWMFDEDVINGPDVFNKTWYPKAKDHINTEKKWYIVDATDKVLGRLASTIAIHIRGKNLATYTPSVDMGAYVIVVNAERVAVTGKKRTQKLYVRHSGRPGGKKVETFDHLQARIPERIIEHAVRGMLPKNRLGRRLFTHLKVYKGPDHPHQAQQPIDLPIRDKRVQLER